MIQFFRKVSKLLRLIDKIDIKEDSEQVHVTFKKNLLISSEDNILLSSGKHMIIKTGSNEPGLLFLNPSIENVSDVNTSVEQSEHDREMKRQHVNKKQYPDKDCEL